VSGGFWEERNAKVKVKVKVKAKVKVKFKVKAKVKVKVNKTIKFHVEQAVSDQLSFLSGRRGSAEDEKNIARSEDI
jgi:hypothetical protein